MFCSVWPAKKKTKASNKKQINYAVAATTIASCSCHSDSPVSPEGYSAEPLFNEGFHQHQRDEMR